MEVVNNVEYWHHSKVFNKFMEQDESIAIKDEYEEPLEEIERKVKKLRDLIKQSPHCTFFTGAGISALGYIGAENVLMHKL